MANIENLKSNSDRTPKERKELASKAGKASGVSRRRKKNLEETVRMAFAIGLTDIAEDRMLRSGLNIEDIDPDDMNGMTAIVIGQMNAAMNGNSAAAQLLAEWYNMALQTKRNQLEIEKLQAEIDRLRNGSDADDDQVLQFIEGMKHDKPDTEAD